MAGEKILLADDDPVMLETLAEFLRGQGYEVLPVGDGSEAMVALAGQEFELALLDLKLPGFSGLDLLSQLKGKAADTEVILFTGHADLDSALQALRLGAYDYLLKSDLLLENLAAVVARALERRSLARTNQELLADLRRAQQDLAQQRAAELAQVRRLGEALAVPLTWEQLFHGLLNLLWESLPLGVLGIEFQGGHRDLSLKAYRRQPEVPDADFEKFKVWLSAGFAAASGETGDARPDPAAAPLPAVLSSSARAGDYLAVVAAGRNAPFSPEEGEMFRIFLLQGEAALKNLALFEEVKGLAIRDGLTGLYNYRHFWELLLHEVELSRRYGQPLALLFLDLDNFKVINDTLGHPQGDTALKAVAAYLQGAVRQADVVCRYGGEEFVVILPQTGGDQALVLGERLRCGLAKQRIPLGRQELQLSVSIGVADLKPTMDASGLLQAADAALYRAKQTGKNQVCVPPD